MGDGCETQSRCILLDLAVIPWRARAFCNCEDGRANCLRHQRFGAGGEYECIVMGCPCSLRAMFGGEIFCGQCLKQCSQRVCVWSGQRYPIDCSSSWCSFACCQSQQEDILSCCCLREVPLIYMCGTSCCRQMSLVH